MAMSLDGCVSAHRGEQHWLTEPLARERVRDLRADHDAVMVGAGTIRIDDPLLTVRPYRSRRKPYVRVVVCERDPIPPESAVLRTVDDAPSGAYAPTIVLAPGAARDRFAALEDRADVVYAGAGSTLDLEAA